MPIKINNFLKQCKINFCQSLREMQKLFPSFLLAKVLLCPLLCLMWAESALL
jgi:hypothetical protein